MNNKLLQAFNQFIETLDETEECVVNCRCPHCGEEFITDIDCSIKKSMQDKFKHCRKECDKSSTQILEIEDLKKELESAKSVIGFMDDILHDILEKQINNR